MGSKNSPDYGEMAASQGEENREVIRDQTYANRPGQRSPFGYTEWDTESHIDPATGQPVSKWTQTTGLTPELQRILDKQIAIQEKRSDVAGGLTGRMESEFGQSLDYGGLSPLRETPQEQFTLPEDYSGVSEIGDPNRIRERAEESIYNKARSRLEPQFDSKRKALEIQMRNQGIGPEDEVWKSRMQGLGQQETDAYGQAQYDAVSGGRAEAGQMFGQDVTRRGVGTGERDVQYGQALGANQQNFQQQMQAGGYAAQIRQQQLTEAMQKRGFNLNEINALLSGQQVGMPTMPNFQGAAAAQPAPVYQAGVDQGNFDQASQQQMINAATGMAGGAMMMSERTMKTNVRPMAPINGKMWYAWDYIGGGSGQGFMADEVNPEYTTESMGYRLVDQTRALLEG